MAENDSIPHPAARAAWMPRLALGLAALALAASGLLLQQLQAARQELARQSADSAAAAAEARKLSAQAEALVQELQVRLGVAEVRLSEVSLQRGQLEELMLSVSRTRDDSLVQDLEAALQLAQQQSELTGSAQPLISALQSADLRIVRAAQPRLNPVQRAIAHDVERIRAAALLDVPALAARIDELLRDIDALPLASAAQPPAAVGAKQPPKPASLPADAGAWQRVQAWASDWAARVWDGVSARGSELLRVSRVDAPEALLLAPEQAYFLRENAKLQLLNARLALLARQIDSSRASLAAVDALLASYFDARSRATAQARESLQALQRDVKQTELPRPGESLAALAAAARAR